MKGKIDLPAQGERNFARNLEDNEKKFFVQPCRVGEREKVLKSFLKGVLNKSNLIFKKPDS